MSDQNENLNPLEQSLRSFAPAPPRLDRDRLMFLAGQANATASGRREPPDGLPFSSDHTIKKLTHPARRGANWLWPTSTATLAATSLSLAIALFTRPAPQPQWIVRDVPALPRPIEQPLRIVAVPAEAAATPRDAAARRDVPATSDSYLKTRDVALRMGLDALGAPSAGGGGSAPGATYLELLEGLAGGNSSRPATDQTERFPNL